MAHPISGPITPEELQRIAELPYGKAAEALRKHDPVWGLATAEKPNIKWEVTLTGTFYGTATVQVEASTQADAQRLALDMEIPRRDWEMDRYSAPEEIEVDETKPVKP